jgi:hypothetical protein
MVLTFAAIMLKVKNKIGLVQFLINLGLWLILILIPIFASRSEYGIEWSQVRRMWLHLILLLPVVFINRWLLIPTYLFRNRYYSYFISIIFLIIVICCFSVIFEPSRGRPGNPSNNDHPPPAFFTERPELRQPPPPPPPNSNPIKSLSNLIILSLLVIGFDTGIKLSARWVVAERERALLEKENIETQMAMLRNQVSPHFIMNTLNNIHSLVDIDAELSKEAIVKLSKMLRYMLYEHESGNVKLSREFEFIQSYIDLMKLRVNENIMVQLHIPEQYKDVEIPALLFISYIENAFKHGVSYKHDSFIDILFRIDDKDLFFQVTNSVHSIEFTHNTKGIELKNSQHRLNLLYPDKHELIVNNTGSEFQVKLKIPL